MVHQPPSPTDRLTPGRRCSRAVHLVANRRRYRRLPVATPKRHRLNPQGTADDRILARFRHMWARSGLVASGRRTSTAFALDPHRFDAPWPGVLCAPGPIDPSATAALLPAPTGKPIEPLRSGRLAPANPSVPGFVPWTRPVAETANPTGARADAHTLALVEDVRRDAERYLSDVEERVRRLRHESEARARAAAVEVSLRLAAAEALAAEWLAEADAERDAIIASARAEAALIIENAESASIADVRRSMIPAQVTNCVEPAMRDWRTHPIASRTDILHVVRSADLSACTDRGQADSA